MMTPVQDLRAATDDDVSAALEGASLGNWPQDEADLLEFLNRMLDVTVDEVVRDHE